MSKYTKLTMSDCKKLIAIQLLANNWLNDNYICHLDLSRSRFCLYIAEGSPNFTMIKSWNVKAASDIEQVHSEVIQLLAERY